MPCRLLGALALLCLLHAAPGARADDDLVVADQKGQQKALLEAAGADQGLPYRIRWTEFEAAAPLLQALGAGAVDTGIAGDGPFLFAWGAGLPVRAALLIPPRGGGRATAVVVPSGSPIHALSGLSGKRVATGRGSIGHLLLLRLIQTGAIPAPAPHIVFLAPAQAKAALDSGGIDAWSTWEPYVSLETIQNHGAILADGAGVMPNNSFFVATDAALAHKHAQLADFYRRVARAYAWGALHQRDYAALLARQTGLPQTVADAVAQKLIATPAAVGDGVVKAEQVTLDAYRAAGFLSSVDPFETAFDRSFTLP
ncbi:ABC transporter substrate-binding protein [Gluconacetobacter azotocaptans]|uniref:Putative aliphatic sulfonates-binding protein n=2 Tax=Gluconacetobacter azotocaptans TaxID=142834 RepID=A0A7W4JQD1_9PROT|nr:ABC transporter substrate-binding protein [Gluconacetobacter azotocaptans]MBM9401434.1 ABC transporter substrate-binding protein [Gluconacetobacter azotocaptans]